MYRVLRYIEMFLRSYETGILVRMQRDVGMESCSVFMLKCFQIIETKGFGTDMGIGKLSCFCFECARNDSFGFGKTC